MSADRWGPWPSTARSRGRSLGHRNARAWYRGHRAPRQTRRAEAGISVQGNASPFIIVQALEDVAGVGVDDEPGAAEVVGEDAVADAVLDEVRGEVGFVGVDETADDLVAAIEFGDGAKLVLIEEPLYKGTVELLADPPLLAVDEIVDDGPRGQGDGAQIAEHTIAVGRGERPGCRGARTASIATGAARYVHRILQNLRDAVHSFSRTSHISSHLTWFIFSSTPIS